MGRKRSPENAKLGQHVQRRADGRLELRFPLPEDVQAAFPDRLGRPRRVLIEQLGTTDVALANERADQKRVAIRERIQKVRSLRSSDALNEHLRELFAFERAQFDQERRKAPVSGVGIGAGPEQTAIGLFTRHHQARALTAESYEERRAAVGWAADWYFEKIGQVADPTSPEYRMVVDECANVLSECIAAQVNAVHGLPELPPLHPALKPMPDASQDGNVAMSQRGRFPIRKYFEECFLKEAKATRGDRTHGGRRQAVDRFVQLVGNKPIYLITKADVWEFHDKLMALPDSRYLSGENKKRSLSELIERRKAGLIDVETLSWKTVNKHLWNLKTVMDHAEKRRDIKENVARGVQAEGQEEDETGRSFSTAELNRIFSQPLFVGCAEGLEEGGLFKPGPVLIRDDRFWIPLLLLYTGARSSEIAGLAPEDVVVDHEVPHILIRPNHLRHLKNKHSKRMVPVHRCLLEMGFAAFAREQHRSGLDRFFPLIEQTAYREGATGELVKRSLSSSLILRQFNRTILEHAEARENSGSIKCFRNTFEQEALARIESDEIRRRLTGRDVNSTVIIYTTNIPDDFEKRKAQLRALRSAMDKIVFEGVDLSRLVPDERSQAAE